MEEKKSRNILLIVIIVLLTLMLLMLGYYTFFVKSDNKTNTNNNQNVKEETNDKEETNIINEKKTAYEEYSDMGVFIDGPTKADLATEAVLARVEKNINDLTKKEWQQFVLTRAVMFTLADDSVNNAECDQDPFNSDVSTNYSMKCILGLTDDEIKKADMNFFEDRFAGSTGFESYKLTDIKAQIKNIYGSYGNMFDKQIDFVSPILKSNIFYDAKIDKVFIHWFNSPTIGISDRYIVSKTIEKDLYKVEYFDFTMEDKLKDSKGNVISNTATYDNYKQLVEDNIDKFPKKVVTFKLVKGVYKFDNEKDV